MRPDVCYLARRPAPPRAARPKPSGRNVPEQLRESNRVSNALAGKLCHGVQIHVDGPWYDHASSKPWRVQALAFKDIRRFCQDCPLWRDFGHEYEFDRPAIDLINGLPLLREPVDDPPSTPEQLPAPSSFDEASWVGRRDGYLLYR